LNLDEIYEMRASGLVRYGSHGKRHTRLVGSLDPRLLMDEVMGSRDLLRTLLGDPVGLFCYPNGDWSPDALEVVRMNYSAAVATSPGWNFPETDGHLLHRISVHEDVASDAFTFLSRVSGLA
jgi:peptidoglycan/xylan/chitin deacetylase (PgdA/CDA1 family)